MIKPGFMRKDGIRADTADFDPERLEFFVMSSEVFEFGRTYESEISRIEEENEPFSFKLSQTCLLESVFMEHFEGKVRDFLTDEREFVFTASPAATHIILHKT